MMTFKEYLKLKEKEKCIRVIVSVDQNTIDQFMTERLEEAKKATVGRSTAYKHPPHFQGGEYHGHSDLENGYQVSWTITGRRLHPNKFPADDKIPKSAKAAVAKVLGVSPNLLEGYMTFDDIEGEEVILFKLSGKSRAKALLEQFRAIGNQKNTDA
jgi:hypothetical protein